MAFFFMHVVFFMHELKQLNRIKDYLFGANKIKLRLALISQILSKKSYGELLKHLFNAPKYKIRHKLALISQILSKTH